MPLAEQSSSKHGAQEPLSCSWRSSRHVDFRCPEAGDEEDGLCILHSRAPSKDSERFYSRFNEKIAGGIRDFRGVYFPSPISLSGIWENAVFAEATFQAHLKCESVIFQGKCDFDFAKFQSADFLVAQFQDLATFSYSEFFGKVELTGVTFGGVVYFNQARASERVSFGGSRFKGFAIFDGTIFGKSAGFDHARFEKGVSFDHTMFLQNASFDRAECSGDCSFRRTIFSNPESDQSQTKFEQLRMYIFTFRETRFSGEVIFERIWLRGSLDFETVRFDSNFFFRGGVYEAPIMRLESGSPEPSYQVSKTLNESRDLRVSPRILFERVFLGDSARINFEDADLSRTTFAGTNVKEIRFRDVTWARMLWNKRVTVPRDFRDASEGFWWWIWQRFKFYLSTNTVADQFTNSDLEQARRVCRDLKASLDDQKDFSAAADFYYAEMQLKRRQLQGIRRKPYFLYWLTCGYGERPFRALIVLGCLWILLTAAFMRTSFMANQRVHIRASEYANSKSFSPILEEGLNYAARSLVLQQRSSYLSPFDESAVRFTFVANLLGPIQLGLLLLAVKRRFRR